MDSSVPVQSSRSMYLGQAEGGRWSGVRCKRNSAVAQRQEQRAGLAKLLPKQGAGAHQHKQAVCS